MAAIGTPVSAAAGPTTLPSTQIWPGSLCPSNVNATASSRSTAAVRLRVATASTEAAGTPARQAMPDRPNRSAESPTSAVRDTPAPRRLSVERSVTVSALATDAPVDGVAVSVDAAVADTGLALAVRDAGEGVPDGTLLAVCDGDAPRVRVDVADGEGVSAALAETDAAGVADEEAPIVFDDVGVCNGVAAELDENVSAAVSDADAPGESVEVGVSEEVATALAEIVTAAVKDADTPEVMVLVGVSVGVATALADTVGAAVADDDAPTVPELVGVSVGVTAALADTVAAADADDDAPTVPVLVGVSVGVAAALAETVTAAVLDSDKPVEADTIGAVAAVLADTAVRVTLGDTLAVTDADAATVPVTLGDTLTETVENIVGLPVALGDALTVTEPDAAATLKGRGGARTRSSRLLVAAHVHSACTRYAAPKSQEVHVSVGKLHEGAAADVPAPTLPAGTPPIDVVSVAPGN